MNIFSKEQQSQQRTNPTPKQRFMSVANNIKKHHALVDSKEFELSVDFARLQYQADLADRCSNDQAVHWMGMKMLAVEEFLQVFRHLGDVVTIAQAPPARDHLPEFKDLTTTKGN